MSERVRAELAQELSIHPRRAPFHVAMSRPLSPPALHVEGVGELTFPLSDSQAEALREVASPAPYGRGEQTVIDPAVRKTSQIGPEMITFGERDRWEGALASIVQEIERELGIPTPVRATLYKMLVYQPGDFFLPHRDTEKEEGMFATLILTLPSRFEGGELRLSHGEETLELSTRPDSDNSLNCIAFYSDCVHELLPIRAGHRLALIYNLVHQGSGQSPALPSLEVSRLDELLRAWQSDQESSSPRARKLLIPLAHRYSPSALSFHALKGEDRHTCHQLQSAAELSDLELALGLMSVEQTGYAIETSWSERRWHDRYDEDDEDDDEYEDDYGEDDWEGGDHEEDEVFHERLELNSLIFKDSSLYFHRLPFVRDELVPPIDDLSNLPFDEREVHEATGNEGATFERRYQRAALVLWPLADRFEVLGTLPQRERFAAIDRAILLGSPLTKPMIEALIMPLVEGLEALPIEAPSVWEEDSFITDPEHAHAARLSSLLELGARLASHREDPSLLHRLLTGVLGSRPLPSRCVPALLEALAAIDVLEALDHLHRLTVNVLTHSPAGLVAMIERLVTLPADTLHDAIRHTVVSAMLTGSLPVMHRYTLTCLLTTLITLEDEELIDDMARHLPYDLLAEELIDLSPSLLDGKNAALLTPIIRALLPVAIERLGPPPPAPADWVKTPPFTPRTEEEREVAAFLLDPAAQSHDLRALQKIRKDMERYTLKKLLPDLSFETIKKGSPHTLRITKHHRRHAAELKLYNKRLNSLKKLENFIQRMRK